MASGHRCQPSATSTYRWIESLAIERGVLTDEPIHAVVPFDRCPCGQAQPAPQALVIDGPLDGPGQTLDIVDGHKQARLTVLDQLARATRGGSDDGQGRGRGLQQHVGQGLAVGGLDEEVEGVVQRREVGGDAEQSRTCSRRPYASICLISPLQLTATDEHQPQLGALGQETGERLDQQVLSLHGPEGSHAADEEVAVLDPERRSLSCPLGRGEPLAAVRRRRG